MTDGPRDVLAIVGSRNWPEPAALEAARTIIEATLDAERPDKIVSGGAVGIDQLAIEIAKERGIAWEEFLPQHRRWQPQGFEERNIQIVTACTRLLAIRSATSATFGSGWTADRAEERGKPVKRIVI